MHVGDIIAVAPFFGTELRTMYRNGEFGPDATFVCGMDSQSFVNRGF